MNQEIYCSVDTCHYWEKGNYCKANKIMVTSDAAGDSMPDNFDAPQASMAAPTPANTCMETACKTFVPKQSNNINADGVYKQS